MRKRRVCIHFSDRISRFRDLFDRLAATWPLRQGIRDGGAAKAVSVWPPCQGDPDGPALFGPPPWPFWGCLRPRNGLTWVTGVSDPPGTMSIGRGDPPMARLRKREGARRRLRPTARGGRGTGPRHRRTREGTMPKGYIIGHITVNDPEAYKEYVECATRRSCTRLAGDFVVRGGQAQVMEGEDPQAAMSSSNSRATRRRWPPITTRLPGGRRISAAAPPRGVILVVEGNRRGLTPRGLQISAATRPIAGALAMSGPRETGSLRRQFGVFVDGAGQVGSDPSRPAHPSACTATSGEAVRARKA